MEALIFDLDGTLWDSRAAVAEGRNRAVAFLGLKAQRFTADDIGRTMGMPADNIYRQVFPDLDESTFSEMRKRVEAEMNAILLAGGGTFFPGVADGLERLASDGRKLLLVSNCSALYLETFFEWSGLRRLFIDSTCFGLNKVPKSENIAAVMKRNGLGSAFYVGDTAGDHQAALAAGIPYIHANYGFGDPLPDQDCLRISTFAELERLISVPTSR